MKSKVCGTGGRRTLELGETKNGMIAGGVPQHQPPVVNSMRCGGGNGLIFSGIATDSHRRKPQAKPSICAAPAGLREILSFTGHRRRSDCRAPGSAGISRRKT